MIYRVLEINAEDGEYTVLYGGMPARSNLFEAIVEYADQNVAGEDRIRFLNFFYGHKNKLPQVADHVFYRRMVDHKWRFACADYVKTIEPIGLIIIRDIEDDVEEFFE